MVDNNEENRAKLADKVFESMDEDDIRLLAYKSLIKIYIHSPVVFEHDWKHVISDVGDLSD
jgi:hypothetical protein